MVRSGSGKTLTAKRKNARASSRRGSASAGTTCIGSRSSHSSARKFAFRDRRVKKRQFRRLWIVRINAACRMRDMRYSEFMHGLQLAMVALDRKSLSEIAIHDPATFDKLVEIAKKAVTGSKKK